MARSNSNTTINFPPPRNVATKRLNTARHYTLPLLVSLSLTTLILATIYAVCVSQNNHHASATSTENTTNSTPMIPSVFIIPREPDETPQPYSPQVTNSTTETGTNTTSVPLTQPFPQNTSSVPLIFYSSTLPLLSLGHTLVEAVALKLQPGIITTTSYAAAVASTTTISPRSRYSSLLSKLTSPRTFLLLSLLILTPGWLLTASLWTHCEIATSADSISASTNSVCPFQVRAHFMYGISGVSIAKAVIAWVLLVVYVGHALCLFRWWRVMGKWEAIKKVAATTGKVPSGGDDGEFGGIEWEPEEKETGRVELTLKFPPPPTRPFVGK